MGDEANPFDGKPGEATVIREFQFTGDASSVSAILRESKEATAWTETDLLLLRSLSGSLAFVSAISTGVSGVLIARKAADEAEILNLAVHRDERRKGAGKRLVEHLLQHFEGIGVTRVFLEVRESNRGAIAFYEYLGFHRVGRRKGYYSSPAEDALLMERKIGKSTESTG